MAAEPGSALTVSISPLSNQPPARRLSRLRELWRRGPVLRAATKNSPPAAMTARVAPARTAALSLPSPFGRVETNPETWRKSSTTAHRCSAVGWSSGVAGSLMKICASRSAVAATMPTLISPRRAAEQVTETHKSPSPAAELAGVSALALQGTAGSGDLPHDLGESVAPDLEKCRLGLPGWSSRFRHG